MYNTYIIDLVWYSIVLYARYHTDTEFHNFIEQMDRLIISSKGTNSVGLLNETNCAANTGLLVSIPKIIAQIIIQNTDMRLYNFCTVRRGRENEYPP